MKSKHFQNALVQITKLQHKEKHAGEYALNGASQLPSLGGSHLFLARIPKFPMPCHKAERYPFFKAMVTYKKATTCYNN